MYLPFRSFLYFIGLVTKLTHPYHYNGIVVLHLGIAIFGWQLVDVKISKIGWPWDNANLYRGKENDIFVIADS